MIIKYICECCDRLVEEILLSEDLLSLLDEEEVSPGLTGLNREDIINLEQQGSLVLHSMCPECREEMNFDRDAELGFGTPVIN